MGEEKLQGQLPSKGAHYCIKVRGVLDASWSSRLGGLHIAGADGKTTLTGCIVDQAALHGLLSQIRDLGLPLLLVQQLEVNSETDEEIQS